MSKSTMLSKAFFLSIHDVTLDSFHHSNESNSGNTPAKVLDGVGGSKLYGLIKALRADD
jgi:hypothetical protein